MKNIIIYLMIVIGSLVLIDIGTGLWFFNRPALEFDSTKFNNIATPIATILASVAVIVALSYSRKQNSISLSSNIKSYYEHRFSKLLSDAKDFKIQETEGLVFLENKEYNALNYPNAIYASILALIKDDQYREDLENFEDKGILNNYEYYRKRSYYRIAMFVNGFTVGFNNVSNIYYRVESFLTEIEESNLIEEDKQIFVKKIKSELLVEYIGFIKNEKMGLFKKPKILTLYNAPPKQIQFNFLFETSFGDLYNLLEKRKLI